MPIQFSCECGKPVFFKQPKCGYCFDVIDWKGVKRYEHI